VDFRPSLKCIHPLGLPSPTRRRGTDSPRVLFSSTRSSTRIRFSRGFHAPAPSALRVLTLSAAFAPRTWQRPVSRCSIHEIYPSRPCSARTAVPFSGPRLSCRSVRSPKRPDPRLQRLAPSGQGPEMSPRRRLRTLPSWDFAPPGFSPRSSWKSASRFRPLIPFRPKVLPTVHFRAGFQGL